MTDDGVQGATAIAFVQLSQLRVVDDLRRSKPARQFQERLQASIESIGLSEPLKICRLPNHSDVYEIIDGVQRFAALSALYERDRLASDFVPAYVFEYRQRYELRFQSDIYQDLKPSQMAELIETLHVTAKVSKKEIASYIGVSAATLRNYTGLWRLVKRGGLFASLVELMDLGVLPASNPYAWLRLNAAGVRHVIETHLADSPSQTAEAWVAGQKRMWSMTPGQAISLKQVEASTATLPAHFYRGDESLRLMKRDLGERRRKTVPRAGLRSATTRLVEVESGASEVFAMAARALRASL